jgi:micrococcal nuclease
MLTLALAFSINAVVVSIYDGDTFHVQIGSRVDTVRVMSIDTPEMPPRNKCPDEVKRASAAKRALEILMPVGSTVRLYQSGSRHRDRYGRLLANAVTPSGAEVGQTLIAQGFARPWKGRREDWCLPLPR